MAAPHPLNAALNQHAGFIVVRLPKWDSNPRPLYLKGTITIQLWKQATRTEQEHWERKEKGGVAEHPWHLTDIAVILTVIIHL